MARALCKQQGHVLQDTGHVHGQISKAIAHASKIKDGLMITFRPKQGGPNRHEVIKVSVIDQARPIVLDFMRSGLVPVS